MFRQDIGPDRLDFPTTIHTSEDLHTIRLLLWRIERQTTITMTHHYSQNLTRVVTFMITITSLPETLQVLIIHFPSQHWLALEDVLEVDTYVVS